MNLTTQNNIFSIHPPTYQPMHAKRVNLSQNGALNPIQDGEVPVPRANPIFIELEPRSLLKKSAFSAQIFIKLRS